MMPPMGRILAIFGWLAWQAGRPFRATILRRLGSAPVVALAATLVALAVTPIVVPMLEPQPEDATVQQVFDAATTQPDGWIRLRGRIVPLADSPTGEAGAYALLVDEINELRAIVATAASEPAPVASTMVTGTLTPGRVEVVEDLPIEATVAGTPPRIVKDRYIVLDAVAAPPRTIQWPLAIPSLVLASILLVGARVGYPVFRTTAEIDVLANPMAPGERVPTAYGGRIGANVADLLDPAGALLLVRPGPRGNLLTAQPLAEDGRVAPQPVTIGGSWTSGRVGSLHTVRETVPALKIRSELVDATFVFARTPERDRVAALVTVER